MKDKTCLNCSQRKNCNDSFVSWIFFIIGLIATVAIRVVTVLMNIHPAFGKIAWYIGVGGFLLFFIYKFNANRGLYNLIAGILCSLTSEKERINYFFIFAVSAVALLLAVYFDFIK